MAADDVKQKPLRDMVHGQGLAGHLPVAQREEFARLREDRILTVVELGKLALVGVDIQRLLRAPCNIEVTEIEMEELKVTIDFPAGAAASGK